MDRRVERQARTVDDTRRLGAALGRAVDPVPRAGLVIVLLGDLGAGKTVFAGGLVHGLGAPAATVVVSPTFTIARGYRGRMPIVHMDAYHLHRLSDLEAAGFEEMGGDGRVTVVEWGDRIATALPSDRLEATITLALIHSDVPESPNDSLALIHGDVPESPNDSLALIHGDVPESPNVTRLPDDEATPAGATTPVTEFPRRIVIFATGPESARILSRFDAASARRADDATAAERRT